MSLHCSEYTINRTEVNLILVKSLDSIKDYPRWVYPFFSFYLTTLDVILLEILLCKFGCSGSFLNWHELIHYSILLS